jgi:hypothetical protein
MSRRHCERSEAIQSRRFDGAEHRGDRSGGLDCFVASLLAMTIEYRGTETT